MFVHQYQFSHSVVSDSLQPHGLQQARLPCPSPTPVACSNSHPLSWWCHPTILSSVVPFSSCFQSFPASGSFPMSQFFASGGQSIGASASASVLPMNIQDWFPLGWTGWISLQSKGLSRVFSNTRVQRHLFFSAQISLCHSAFYMFVVSSPILKISSGWGLSHTFLWIIFLCVHGFVVDIQEIFLLNAKIYESNSKTQLYVYEYICVPLTWEDKIS